LYDSFTHRPDEGELSKTVKQVWASLWNFRAYDERDFHRIDHLSAAMGVLVHPNFDDEIANGVAVTKNPYDPNWPGFYVNVQVGESLVTNPDPSATPDELLISAIGEHGEYETQHIRHSTLTQDGKPVLSAEQVATLTTALETIQERFKVVYEKQGDDGFAMDVEFKFGAGGGLVVKQARPWVE
jgi:phosphoenolpyruvate synthase/pyruvate phosphate dikinase